MSDIMYHIDGMDPLWVRERERERETDIMYHIDGMDPLWVRERERE